MKYFLSFLFAILMNIGYSQGCMLSTSNLIELTGDDGSGLCTYSIDILFTEGSGPDNGTLTFSSATSTILGGGAGPHTCACSGTTYTITFESPCGADVSFTANHDNSGNGNDCSVTEDGITTLPVEWHSFTTHLNEQNQVSLNWSTAFEVNNDYFDVEYSQDGINFTVISSVKGSGNSSSPKDYYSIHQNPNYGLSYYRIKQIDYDGNYSYSKINIIEAKHSESITLYPNPANNFINIKGLEKNSKVFVLDLLGNVLLNPTESTIDINELSKGIYYISIENIDQTTTNKFIKL